MTPRKIRLTPFFLFRMNKVLFNPRKMNVTQIMKHYKGIIYSISSDILS